ncbi:MAG: type II secretion system protein [Candidatus Omnitrophica bacterium]|nr:type II secretion system protein [Candidatus Omnitrophota bacterium]
MMLLTGVNKARGYTLVEIMASVLILGVVLVFVANSYAVALRGAGSAANIIEAMRLGQEKIEALEASNLKGTLPGYHAQGTIKSSFKEYNYELVVYQVAGFGPLAEHLVEACLGFNWQEQNSNKNASFSIFLPKQKE